MSTEILKVENLVTTFSTDSGRVSALSQVSFDIRKGQTVGLVGESGSGKSVTSLSIMRLIQPPGQIAGGRILFDGLELLALPEIEMRRIRGNRLSMIFQEPMTSLNPVFSVGSQIAEVFRIHKGLNKKDAMGKAIEMLRLVKIPAPEKRAADYPHQLSGGMRQRVMIAMALACKPQLLIADEPTTALDVTIQAQILDLMAQLREELGMAVLLITHDLGVVAEICDSVMVMYAGRIVETGSVKEVFEAPRHPYTQGLLNSIPKLGRRVEVLPSIKGTVPSLANLPSGCSFSDRCTLAITKCRQERPVLKKVGSRYSACWVTESIQET